MVTELASHQAKSVGPPKSKDRKVIVAMIGAMAAIILALIAFVTFSDFPGQTEGSADKTAAPPEDVRR